MSTNEKELKISKSFNSSVNELYNAWISPDHLKQWWHPMGNNLKEVELEVKRDGAIKYAFVNEKDKSTFEITGKYYEVTESQRLVYSWNWKTEAEHVENNNYTLTIVFAQEGDGSKIEVTQTPFSNEEALQQHKQGWEKALNDLEHHLSSK